jgi:hypothetical protein
MTKNFTHFFVVIALVLAVLAVALPGKHVGIVISIENFFEIMIPVLAVGALLKFLYCCKD